MRALRRTLAVLAPSSPRSAPRPRTSVRSSRGVPALVLRGVLGLLVVAAGGAVATTTTQWWIVVAGALVVAVRPHAALLSLAVGLLAALLALEGQAWWQLPVLVLLTHGVLRLGALVDAVAWQGRVELGVLRDALPGFLPVQAVGQVAAVLALVLDGAAPVPWLVVGGVSALALVGWAVVRQVRATAR